MRIVLFYSETESFNFFTDRLAEELKARGHEVFILDYLQPRSQGAHSYQAFAEFAVKKIDAVICFDGLGSREDMFIELWDAHEAVVVNILMDHPLRFHPMLAKHPRRYLLFCCDWNHVEYVKRYFGREVPCVLFMPHVGVLPKEDSGQEIPYEKRKFEILFSGTYYQPESMLSQIKEQLHFNFSDNTTAEDFYRRMYQELVRDSSLTTEAAVLDTAGRLGWQISEDAVKMLMNGSVYVDWAIRMYQRERVVKALAEAGLPLYLLGRGGENHPSVHCKNVHHLNDRVPYAETLPLMADAKINLNVFPWFKYGTHDRIFNTLLQHSLPLTDSSRWIEENFTDGEDIALYDLDHLEELPRIAEGLLSDPDRAEAMIEKGYEKVRDNLTWGHCTEWVLEGIRNIEKGRYAPYPRLS